MWTRLFCLALTSDYIERQIIKLSNDISNKHAQRKHPKLVGLRVLRLGVTLGGVVWNRPLFEVVK